jgi:SAM-dependent methyltransferase
VRARFDLFVVSFLVLFLELAAIRWFPANVLFLTFFTNTVLLACFLGMSIGCLAADRRRNYLTGTPFLLALALGAAHLVEWARTHLGSVEIGSLVSPQLVFFGAEYQGTDPSKFLVPIEIVAGALFALIALAMLGPGQVLGRALARVPNRLEAYTINIGGSLAGVLLFTACSFWQAGPVWWFGITVGILIYLLMPDRPLRALALATVPAVMLLATGNLTLPGSDRFWSPYYRVDYDASHRIITVNLIGHQQMISRESPAPAYALPHLLNRDAGRPRFGQVLIIGAGSGNDVSRALEWGATRVDAVEIDPVIQRLGLRHHPDRPYSDPRVFVHLDDGRNVLHSTNRQYDLIVYALVDSLVLHSSHSNIRLESYLFTTEAFADVRKRLRPGGLFVMYNYFRQGWIVTRLDAMLQSTFGPQNPIVLNLPSREFVRSYDVMGGDFTMFIAGATDPIKQAFARSPSYQLPAERAPDVSTPNGFVGDPRAGYTQFRPTRVVAPSEPIAPATDSWPFLYLRRPMIPALSLRGMGVMALVAAVMLAPFLRRSSAAAPPEARSPAGLLAQMALLGAGFMLIETRAVVQMALLFGGTWLVNAIVFCAVLVMILGANLFVLAARPRSLTPFYVALLVSLVVGLAIPLDSFLGLSRAIQIAASCLLAFTPILFAGIVFAVSFGGAAETSRAFGMNVAGAMVGGLAEYSSMLLGFQYVTVLALAFYALSWFSVRPRSTLRDARLVDAPGTVA